MIGRIAESSLSPKPLTYIAAKARSSIARECPATHQPVFLASSRLDGIGILQNIRAEPNIFRMSCGYLFSMTQQNYVEERRFSAASEAYRYGL